MNDQFKNANVLITGGGSGIGKSAAHFFIDRGANVVLLDKDLSYWHSQSSNVLLFSLDITDNNLLSDVFEKIAERFDSVSCTGICV